MLNTTATRCPLFTFWPSSGPTLRTIPPTRETTGVSLYAFAWTTPVAICPAASDEGRSPTVSIFSCAVRICSGVNVSFSSPAVAGCGDSSNETERGAATGLPACFGHKSHAAIATTTIPIAATATTSAVRCLEVLGKVLIAGTSPSICFSGCSFMVSSTPVKPWRVRSRPARCKQRVAPQ